MCVYKPIRTGLQRNGEEPSAFFFQISKHTIGRQFVMYYKLEMNNMKQHYNSILVLIVFISDCMYKKLPSALGLFCFLCLVLLTKG